MLERSIIRQFPMIDTILFDWDGTLIDTAQQAYCAFQKALASQDIPLDHGIYERIYSPNWYRMYEALQLPREKWKEVDDFWIRNYENENPSLMPGGQAALNELVRRNYGLGIVTSGSRMRVLREIKKLGLMGAFRIVVCSEDVVNKKPHPEGLEEAMKQLAIGPESCCYVGDSPDDIQMGKGARVLTVGIPGPFPASRTLRSSNPDLYFNSLEEFVGHLAMKASIPNRDGAYRPSP
jgi:HAD superfamily hydrolase (TIGR01509 family)